MAAQPVDASEACSNVNQCAICLFASDISVFLLYSPFFIHPNFPLLHILNWLKYLKQSFFIIADFCKMWFCL